VGQIHNELTRAGRILVGIKNILGVRDTESGVERFGETLQPILDPWSQPEFAWSNRHFLRGATITDAADVANISSVLLFLPANVSTLVIVEHIFVNTSAAQTIIFAVGSLDAPDTEQAGIPRDTRDGFSTGPSVARIGPRTAAALGGDSTLLAFPTDSSFRLELHHPGIVLTQGTELVIGHAAVNRAITVAMWWREYESFPTERPPE